MAKITRYSGNLKAFGSAAQGTERTVFGGTAQSDLLTDNVDASFLRGWGIVPVNGNPTKQDFNALGFTVSQMLAYLHQQGVAEWDAAQEYNVDAVVVIGSAIYISKTNANIGNPPVTDSGANWTHATARANMPQGLQRVSTSLPTDYQLQTWSDALEDGHYDVSLTVAQNGLPAGWWYIDVQRHTLDGAANPWRTLTATSFGSGNTPNDVYQSTDNNGIWTPFERMTKDVDFTASLTPNGYQKLPSGLIMQWGSTPPAAIPANGSLVIVFPLTFPNQIFGPPLVSSLSRAYYTVSTGLNGVVSSFSTTSFTAVNASRAVPAVTNGCTWTAIGY